MTKSYKTVLKWAAIGVCASILIGCALIAMFAQGLVYETIGLFQDVSRDVNGAQKSFDKAVQVAPSDPYVYDTRARFRERRNNFFGALEDLSQSIKLNSKRAMPFAKRGELRTEQGDFKGAESDIESALKLDAKSAYAHVLRAQLWEKQKDLNKAISEYDQAIAIDPNSARTFFLRARTYDNLGNKKKSLIDYTQSVKLAPDALTYAYKGKVTSELGDKKTAISDLDKSIKMDPQSAISFAYRGRVRSDLEDHKGALDDFAKSAQLRPKYALYFRGRYESLEPTYKSYKLTPADIEFGEKQVRAMLDDRKKMSSMAKKGDPVWNWTVHQFGGEGLGCRIYWSNKKPLNRYFDAQNSGPTSDNKFGEIRIGERNDMGKVIDGENLWSNAVFELYNIRNSDKFAKVFSDALNEKISKTEFVRRYAELEFEAELAHSMFYRKVWLPNAVSTGATTTDVTWRVDEPNTFEDWINQFKDNPTYPNCYALAYEQTVRPYIVQVANYKQALAAWKRSN